MKSILAISAMVLAFSNIGSACEGLETKATHTALEFAKSTLGACEATSTKKTYSSDSWGVEHWRVQMNCANHPTREYMVRFNTKTCEVKSEGLIALPGSQCGLTNHWGGDWDNTEINWKFDDSKKLSLVELAEEHPAVVKALPARITTQLQLYAGSNEQDILKLIAILEDENGWELYHTAFSFKGKNYETVYAYPGDTHVALVFPEGSVTPVAESGDGDVACIDNF